MPTLANDTHLVGTRSGLVRAATRLADVTARRQPVSAGAEVCQTGAVLSAVADLLDGINHEQRAALGHSARLGLVTQAQKLANRVDGLLRVLVGEAEQAGSSMAAQGTPTTTWLGMVGQMSPKQASGLVFAGKELTTHPITRQAALSGQVNSEQARTIHSVLTELPQDLDDEQRQAAETLLVEHAASTPAEGLAKMAPQVLAEVAPDHPATSVADELARLDAQRKRAQAKRSLWFGSDGDGSTLIRGSLPTLDAAPLIKLISAYVESDRRTGRERLDRLAEQRTPEQRRADALLALVAAHQQARQAPGVIGDRPRVVVIMQAEQLRQQAEQAGLLEQGEQIGAGDLRRLCCDADLMPAVLGGASEVLDIGRTQRLVTPAIRRGLSLRDGGCVFPGCDQSDARCEAHHIQPWWDGGTTALDNLVLLCPHHHQLVEPPRFWSGAPPDRWQIRLDQHGMPEVLPPTRVDPERRPIPERPPIPDRARPTQPLGERPQQQLGPPETHPPYPPSTRESEDCSVWGFSA